MNLADAIRRAAQGEKPVVVAPAPTFAATTSQPEAMFDGDWDIAEVSAPDDVLTAGEPEPAPETVAIPQTFISNAIEETSMNPTPHESNPEAATSGATVRLELFLTPEQLSNLFRAVAANQHTMLTLREAASYLRVSASSLEAMAFEGELPGFSIDGKWRFSKAAIDEWLAAKQYRKECA